MERVLVRSRGHFVLLTVLQRGGFLEREGLAPTFELCDVADDADAILLRGDADLISGSHHTPYLHYDDGEPMVILGSTTNAVTETLVTREPVADLSEMRGRRLALSPLLAPGERPATPSEGHPRANIQIMLERAGIGGDAVSYLGYGPNGAPASSRLESVAEGFADGAFGGSDRDAATQYGLQVLELPPLPMISGVTLTTTWRKLEEHAEEQFYLRFVRALAAAVRFFVGDREGTIEILRAAADELRLHNEAQVQRRYGATAQELEVTLVPTAEAIRNALRIAEFERPGISQRVNPLALWDLHFVRAASCDR